MEIRYEVPKYLEDYIAPMTEKDLSKLLTVLFDIAVRHRMFEYPSLAIERDVHTLANEIGSISKSIKLMNSAVGNYNTALSNKIDSNNADILKILETIKNAVLSKADGSNVCSKDMDKFAITMNSDIEDDEFELPDNDDDIIY